MKPARVASALALIVCLEVFSSEHSVLASDLPPGYWPTEKSLAILAKTGSIRLDPSLHDLGTGERVAAAKLLEVGTIFQALYEQQRHPQASSAFADLQALDRRLGSPQPTRNLLSLYRLNAGPIAWTLDNKREAFLPVDAFEPGRNVYPWRIAKKEVDDWIGAHPEDAETIRGLRTVVRRATGENLRRDLDRLGAYPAIDTLHPGLRRRLEVRLLQPDERALYAVPYSVAYADEMVRAHQLLNEAADAVQKDDREFAIYLRNRSRDLLSDDYESGDAAWVSGRFKNLNALIGAYETYPDALFGSKAFFSLSIFRVRNAETVKLREALRGLQALEDSLPYAAHKTVRGDIPIGLYDVIAEFGDSRGTNTATILPNEAYLTRRYGRTILLRANIMDSAPISDAQLRAWQTIVPPPFLADYTERGELQRTIWHEVGHYLGVDATRDNLPLDFALGKNAGILEELKADLVSLHLTEILHQRRHHNAKQALEIYAAGVLRTMNEIKPSRDQAHKTMQLIQFNYFLESGLISFDAASSTIVIDYTRFPSAIVEFLKQVLDLQYQGNQLAADLFIERYTVWQEHVHGVLGKKILDATAYRYWLVDYAALGQ